MALLWLLLGCALLMALWSKRQLLLLGISLPGPWALPLLGNAQMIGKLKPECESCLCEGIWMQRVASGVGQHVCCCSHLFGIYRTA